MASNTSGVMTLGSALSSRSNYVMQDGSDPLKVKTSYKVKNNYATPTYEYTDVINVPPVEKEQAKPIEIKKETFDAGAGLSMPAGEEFKAAPTGIDKTNQILKAKNDKDAKELQNYKQGMMAASGLQFMSEVLNANNAYRQVQGTAALNIMQSKNQAADAIYRGRQAGMDAQSEGYQAGQDALLNAAAQGQDVNGAGTQKIQNSYEAIGAYNAAQEEINAYREAMGYELEQVNYEYQVDSAKVNRDYAVLGSALNFGAGAYKYGR